MSNKKLPIKEKDETPLLENKKGEGLKDEGLEEGKKAEKLTSGLIVPEEISPQENKIEKTSPRTWKPSEEKSKEGKILPPPAKTWTPEN